MKIIFLHNYPVPYRLTFFQNISKKYDIEVWFLQDPKSENRFWNESLLRSYSFKYKLLKSIIVKLFNRPFVINPSLLKYLYYANFDLIVSIDNFPTILSLYISLLVSKIKGKRFIIWTPLFPNEHFVSKNYLINKLYKLVKSIYRRICFPLSDLIFTYTFWAEEYVRLKHNKNVKILPQVYPECLIGSKNLNGDKNGNNKRILFVGYLNWWKNVEFLINSFLEFNEQNWRLIIIGDGPEKNRLMSLASNNKKIMFKGNLEGWEKYKYFQKTDVLVLLSHKECWGLVVNEAMYFGLPIIVSENVMAKELIRGNGFVINHNSKEDLHYALHCILDNDEVKEKMSKRSLEIIKDYTIDKAVEAFKYGVERVVKK